MEPAARSTSPRLDRLHYTVMAERIDDGMWHLSVPDLPDTWTVVSRLKDAERRARLRIAFDVGRRPADFDVDVVVQISSRAPESMT